MKLKQRLILLIFMLVVATIACAGTVQSLRVEGLPQYICPSSTPKPTHTQPPTSDPIYPPYFVSNLSWYQVVSRTE